MNDSSKSISFQKRVKYCAFFMRLHYMLAHFINFLEKRIFNKRLLLSYLLSHLYYYPVPLNLNYFWGFGSLLGGLLIIQIITGILLAIHYTADTHLAFYSVEFIMRNVEGG